MKRVLVLDASQRSALAVTRSLGKHGIQVFTAEETAGALAGTSRYSKHHYTYPSPRSNPNGFILSVKSLMEDLDIDILLPMTELTTMLLLAHRDLLPDASLPFPQLETVESLSDKCLLMKTAGSLGVPIPKTWYVVDPQNLPFSLDNLPYPIVLKPGKSWLRHNGHWSRAAVRFADSPAMAKSILHSDWAFSAYPYLIQEHITGLGQGVFTVYDNGSPVVFFAHRRLREKPPRGGVSVLSESVPVDQKLRLHSRTILHNANWHGAAMVEFKVTPDGTAYLMEINTRFWGSLQLAIDAGVDFPWLLYQLASGDRIDRVKDYRTGVRLRWLLGDLDHLYLVLRDQGFSGLEKMKAVAAFLTPSPFNTRHEVNRWNDMGPFWWELKQYIRDLSS